MKIDTKTAQGQNMQGEEELHSAASRLETGRKCKNGWYELRPRGKLPEKRSYHSSVIYEGYLYIYGGEDSREGKNDSFWRLNLDDFIEIGEKESKEENKDLGQKPGSPEPQEDGKLTWEQLETTGAKPGFLSHHRSVLIGEEMYIFGGMKSDIENNCDLFSLNMKTLQWKVIQPEGDEKPEGRDDHSICASENSIYVFGGFVKGKRMNDLYEYNIETNTWKILSKFTDIDDFSSEELKYQFPVPRCGQDMVYYQNKIYMFGGRNDFNDKLSDTWEFDISAKTWNKIECEKMPIGRSSHACIVYESKIILFGGIVDITKEINEIDQFDLEAKKWMSIDDKSEQRKNSIVGSPNIVAKREKMNETAPVRGNKHDLTAITLKRSLGNKSMK